MLSLNKSKCQSHSSWLIMKSSFKGGEWHHSWWRTVDLRTPNALVGGCEMGARKISKGCGWEEIQSHRFPVRCLLPYTSPQIFQNFICICGRNQRKWTCPKATAPIPIGSVFTGLLDIVHGPISSLWTLVSLVALLWKSFGSVQWNS